MAVGGEGVEFVEVVEDGVDGLVEEFEGSFRGSGVAVEVGVHEVSEAPYGPFFVEQVVLVEDVADSFVGDGGEDGVGDVVVVVPDDAVLVSGACIVERSISTLMGLILPAQVNDGGLGAGLGSVGVKSGVSVWVCLRWQ